MTNSERTLKYKPKRWIMNLIFSIAMIVAIIFSFSGSTINWNRLATIGISLKYMVKGFAEINPQFLFGYGIWDFNEGILYMGLQTLAIAFIGTLLGAVLAIPFGFLASKTIVGNTISKIGVSFLVFIRVFPELILVIIMIKGFGWTPLSLLLAIGIHSVGMLGKLFSEAIDNMDKSPLEALDAVGANTWQKIRFGIFPQMIADLSSIALYRLDINMRSASVLGIVGTGAGGFGAVLILAVDGNQWPILATVLAIIIPMVLIVDTISSYLRSKLA